MRLLSSLFIISIISGMCIPLSSSAQTSTSNPLKEIAKKRVSIDPQLVEATKKSVDRGIHFLRQQQESDGSYGHHVGLTAMALLAMRESYHRFGVGDGPFISKAVKWMSAQAQANGSISGEATPTYNTALAIMALHALNPRAYKKLIEQGQRFLVQYQSDEDHNYQKKDKYYGGIGYGGDERPDLSNLQYALEALKRTDYDPKSDVWAKAELFVKRCQNYTEEDEKDQLARPWAGNDGGFIYEPGSSRAGGTKSYGAMTFAGLKSLIFTRTTNKKDPRVQAAWSWIQQNYDFNAHPGMGTTAYYYYLQTAASALEAYGEPVVPSPNKPHHWGADLLTKLMNLQQKNGAWQNENRKYWEGNKVLVTARALITINHVFRALGVQKKN